MSNFVSIFRPKLDGHSRFTTSNDLILIVAYKFENADRDNETKSEVCPSNYGTIKYVTSLKFDVAILVTFEIFDALPIMACFANQRLLHKFSKGENILRKSNKFTT